MIRGIVWDLDGTLLDTYPAITRAFVDTMRAHGGSLPAARIGELARVGLGTCAAELGRVLGMPEAAVRDEFGERYRAMSAALQPPFPGATEVCRAVGQAGGMNTIVTHRAELSTRALLEAHGMTGLFRLILSVEHGYPKKPDPAAFRAVLATCGLRATDVLAVGDREIDIQAGHAVGLFTVMYGDARSDPAPDLRITDYGRFLPELSLRGLWPPS